MKNTQQVWNTAGQKLSPQVLRYTAGSDYLLDQEIFLPFDIEASLAHAEMLARLPTGEQGGRGKKIISRNDCANLCAGLREILSLWKQGKFKIQPEQEDCHTAIEAFLTQKYGEAGKRIHTGRSRNDQSLTMIRLYALEQLNEMRADIMALIHAWRKFSGEHQKTPMPGYTHMQKAMPTTVAMWQDSFADALEDELIMLKAAQKLLNQSPLGSGAGYGVPIEIDREFTAKKLGFSKVQKNPMYCQLSRGAFETHALQVAAAAITILGRWAGDLLLFTMEEFGFFSLPQEFCTGSSIMPQKRNYDVLEIMRGNVAVVQSAAHEIKSIAGNLHSGYQRDLQLIKAPLVRGFKTALDSLKMAQTVAKGLIVNKNMLRSAMTKNLFATERIFRLVKKGVPFRSAYHKVKKSFLP